MKVLFWNDYFKPSCIGGTETFLSSLLPQLQRHGHEVSVVACHVQGDLPDVCVYEGIPVHRFHIRRALENNSIEEISKIKTGIARLKREFAPDIIHINSVGPMDLFHHMTAGESSIPYLITVHQRIPRKLLAEGGLIRRTFHKANWTVGVSKATLADLRQLVPEITPCSSYLYCGIPEPPAKPEPLPQQPFRLLCIGRIAPEKRFDLALRAFAQVRSRIPDIRLVIAGDGPLRQQLEQLAVDLGVNDAVDFLGWVQPEKVPETINKATCVLSPSEWEGLGLVAIEAALMRRPVIASRVGGMGEAILNNETGILVEPGSVKSLTDAIVALLDDVESCVRLGDQARKRALEQFNVQNCADAYMAIYQKLALRPSLE
jgi:glycogen(starch) synthase